MAKTSLCLFILLVNIAIAAGQDVCLESSSCGEQSIPIKFPFRLRERQPNHCGCTGFDLSCTGANETVLQLPLIPIELYVTSIDYHSHKIGVRIQDDLWSKKKPIFESINQSSSPFRFTCGFSRVTLLNCSAQRSRSGIPCVVGGHSYNICAILSKSHIEHHRQVISCTKMYEFNAPVEPDGTSKLMGPYSLTWSRKYRKKNGTELESKCLDRFKHRKGPSVKSKVIAGSIAGLVILILLMVIVAILFVYPSCKNKENRLKIEKFLEDYKAFQPSRYAYADIKKITNKFRNKLGQGAYGTVFKGKLSNGMLVAVKILDDTKGNGVEFINEVAIMGRIHHVNVARLVGYCADGLRRALVYEFLPNGSLEKYISSKAKNKKCPLNWEKLQQIALGIAKGIAYLHQGCDKRILHFDIKPHNILLDQNFTPKIADFGLAKLCSKDKSNVSMTTARGTMGYIAPEVFSRNFGNVSYKSDVYSFGILLLEMVGGRKKYKSGKVVNADEVYYPEWIYSMLEEGEDLWTKIPEEGDAKIVKKLATVGLWCIQWHQISRPTMQFVVQMLETKEELTMPPNPFASIGPPNRNNKMPMKPMALELETIAE